MAGFNGRQIKQGVNRRIQVGCLTVSKNIKLLRNALNKDDILKNKYKMIKSQFKV